MAQPSRVLLVTRAGKTWDLPGTRRKDSETPTGMRGAGSHLLNDAAAEGHVGTTEDVRHVARHLQIVLAVHARDLEGKGAP